MNTVSTKISMIPLHIPQLLINFPAIKRVMPGFHVMDNLPQPFHMAALMLRNAKHIDVVVDFAKQMIKPYFIRALYALRFVHCADKTVYIQFRYMFFIIEYDRINVR